MLKKCSVRSGKGLYDYSSSSWGYIWSILMRLCTKERVRLGHNFFGYPCGNIHGSTKYVRSAKAPRTNRAAGWIRQGKRSHGGSIVSGSGTGITLDKWVEETNGRVNRDEINRYALTSQCLKRVGIVIRVQCRQGIDKLLGMLVKQKLAQLHLHFTLKEIWIMQYENQHSLKWTCP